MAPYVSDCWQKYDGRMMMPGWNRHRNEALTSFLRESLAGCRTTDPIANASGKNAKTRLATCAPDDGISLQSNVLVWANRMRKLRDTSQNDNNRFGQSIMSSGNNRKGGHIDDRTNTFWTCTSYLFFGGVGSCCDDEWLFLGDSRDVGKADTSGRFFSRRRILMVGP